MQIQHPKTNLKMIRQLFRLFTFFICLFFARHLFAQADGAVPEGVTPTGTPTVCFVSASQKGSYLKINRHPGSTSLSDTILLNGNSLYKEVRVNLVSLILTGKDTTGQIKDSCLPCYRVPQSMASITGGLLNEFNAVVSNYPGSLPAKTEHNPMELVFTALSPKSFTTEPLVLQFSLPGASASSKCHVIADLFLQITFRDINCLECIIPLTISFDLYSGEVLYADLKEQLDGSYYPAIRGKLCFKYTERYAVPEGKKLNYSIYNKKRQLVTNQGQPNPGMPALHIASGTNFLDLDLSKVSDMTAGEFYVLEVLSDKKDKYYLRFKFLK